MGALLPLILVLGAGALYMLSKASTKPGELSPATPGTPAEPGQLPGPTDPQAPAKPARPETVATAVQAALALETDPAKLAEFAASLLPDYPKESAQLAARAALLELGKVQPPPQLPPAQPAFPDPGPAIIPTLPPSPVAFPGVGSTAYVATNDNGPSGMLLIHDAPSTQAPVVSKVSRGGSVIITDVGAPGFLRVLTPSQVDGYAASRYLAASPPAGAEQPTTEIVT